MRIVVCEDTVEWLVRYGLGGFPLLMRTTGDHRPDYIIKQELFDEHIRPYYNVSMAWDDRNQVVRLWREMGIPTFQVADGNF